MVKEMYPHIAITNLIIQREVNLTLTRDEC